MLFAYGGIDYTIDLYNVWGDIMIKCPHCGSTAQVKVFVGDNLNNIWVGSMGYVQQHLICGCGCEFIRRFVFDDEYIVNNEEGGE